MMKRLLQRFFVVLGLAGVLLVPVSSVGATNVFTPCPGSGDTTVCQAPNNNAILGPNGLIARVINILLYVIGSISIIIIIIGGIRYVTSGGDSAQTKSAKDTVLYAVVGLVIAVMAYAIVNFVVGRLV